MKKFYLLLFVILIGLVSCQYDSVSRFDLHKGSYNMDCSNSVRPLSDALADLDQTLDIIYSGTRSRERKTYSVNNVRTFVVGHKTRTNVDVDIPDTLVYVIDFDNGNGYAVIGAQSNLSSIYAITDEGEFNIDKFKEAINYEVTHNIITGEEYDQRLSDILDDIDSENTCTVDDDFVYELMASSVISDIVMPPVIIDPTPVVPPAPDPYHPIVIGRDTSIYVEFLDYYPPMLTTKWHQYAPFNNKCKNEDDVICPAGCVVIALAQIMAYNEYPENRKFNGVTVDWDVVKQYQNNQNYDDTDEIAEQLSNLCCELGKPYNCDVEYRPSGSSSSIRKAKNTLENYGYRDLDIRHGFTDNDKQIIKDFIKRNKPLYIRSLESLFSSGHAWILDGYIRRRVVTEVSTYYSNFPMNTTKSYGPTQEFVHCNFGWGGIHDGYYLLSSSFNTRHRVTDIDNAQCTYNVDEQANNQYHFDVLIKSLLYDI